MAEAECDEGTGDVPFLLPDSHSGDMGKRQVNLCECMDCKQCRLRSNREIDASHANGDVSRALMQ